MLKAIFSQSRSDMYWKIHTLEDGYVRWVGYDDSYWWDNVAPTEHFRVSQGKSGAKFRLNPETNDVDRL